LRTILGQANELCRTHGIRFLVVFASTKFRVYHGVTEFEGDAQPGYWVINDRPERVGAIVRDYVNEAEYLDLTGPLTDAAERGLLVYQASDTHWSGEGHRIAADAIAAALDAGSARGVGRHRLMQSNAAPADAPSNPPAADAKGSATLSR
jgi:hypothetical protein